mmetsp:Transcript_37508/g.71875  ORF Transcript_37508/g.71875 Transcript_37508/m.71875 type:complete len:192 (-) Transcript_37508:186-761(-)
MTAPSKFIKPYGGRRVGGGDIYKGGRNPWIWKFVPGVVLGYLAKLFFDQNVTAQKKVAAQKKPEELANIPFSTGSKLKMVLVVRQDLSMGTGKIAAQCGHATLGAYKQLEARHKSLLKVWERSGQAKIVLKCKDENDLLRVDEEARKRHLPTHIVTDAGHTQIAAGSMTVCAVGPAPVEDVDAVTGRLKLL